MASPRKFHLFNCDRLCKLDPIEDFLLTTIETLGIKISVKQHYFSLSEISEFSDQTIPTLEMDAAVLAVHANESRLSINEDTQGGYTKVYRALLQATEGNVIVVVGGDNNYSNEEEKKKAVASRWARRKIRSQLKEEFLDGRKSFLFTWDRKHRAIHEQALKHYFDLNKKGQKFEYEPSERPELSLKDPTAPLARVTEPAHQPRLQRSATLPEGKSKREIEERRDLSSSSKKDHAVTRQRSVDFHTNQQPKLQLDPLSATAVSTSEYGCSSLKIRSEQHRAQIDTAMKETCPIEAPTDVAADSGRKLLDNKPQQPSMRTDTAMEKERQVIELAVLGCDASLDTMQVVKSVIKDLQLKINLPKYPLVENYSLDYIKSYLTRNTLCFCVLVVDKEALNTIQRHELEDVLWTAADVVVEKVIFTISDRCPALKGGEETFVHNIQLMLKEKRKGLIVWLEDGKLNVEPDVLIQLMLGAPIVAKNRQGQISHSGELSRPTNAVSGFSSDGRLVQGTQKHTGSLPSLEMYHTIRPDTRSTAANNYGEGGMNSSHVLVLKTRIHYGIVSYASKDLEFRCPDWVIPEQIEESLRCKYSTTANGVLSIYYNKEGQLQSTVQTDRAAFCLII